MITLAEFALLLFILGTIPPALGDEDARSLARSVEIAYQANRQSFGDGQLELQFSVGTTNGIEQAVSGDWQDQFSTTGMYAYSGEWAVFSCVFPLESVIAERRKAAEGWISSLDSRRALTNGKSTLIERLNAFSDEPRFQRILSIDEDVTPFFRIVDCPLNLRKPSGSFDLSRDLSRVLNDGNSGMQLASAEFKELDGQAVVRLSIAFDEGRRDYRIDVEHGAIPVLISNWGADDGKEPIVQLAYRDIRQVEAGGWLPHLTTLRYNHGLTKQISVIRADFSTKPPRSVFKLDFPEPVGVLNSTSMVAYDPRDVWSLDDLPGTGSPQGRQLIATQPGAPLPEMPGERPAFPTRLAASVALGLLLIGGLAWSRLRRKG